MSKDRASRLSREHSMIEREKKMRLAPRDIRHHFQRSEEDFFASRRNMGCRGRDVWHPPTDVYETKADVVIKMSLPGIRPDHVTVACNGDTITVCGVRNRRRSEQIERYHQMEIRNGYFERRITIHIPFDPSQAHGHYEDGFLLVHIPKTQQRSGQVVTIRLTL
jgi:HSP20 family protein